MVEAVPVKVSIDARWRDLDALGHVNNAVYLSYFEHARMGYIRALLGDVPMMDNRTPLPKDFQVILADVRVSFRSPALLSDALTVSIWVAKVGRKSFVFDYRMDDEKSGRLVAEASSTLVWYDYAAGETRPVPEEIIAKMEALQGAPIPRAR
jgi:acyl-CoA thioester hydrolase